MALTKGIVELKSRMVKLGLTTRDVERLLAPQRPNSKSGRVSRLLNGKRPVSTVEAAIFDRELGIPASWFGLPANGRAA